jgi:hypothetical protein
LPTDVAIVPVAAEEAEDCGRRRFAIRAPVGVAGTIVPVTSVMVEDAADALATVERAGLAVLVRRMGLPDAAMIGPMDRVAPLIIWLIGIWLSFGVPATGAFG